MKRLTISFILFLGLISILPVSPLTNMNSEINTTDHGMGF